MSKVLSGLFIASTLFGTTLFGACGSSAATGRASVIDAAARDLALGSVQELSGDYGVTCSQRSGGWSLGLGSSPALSNPPLSVLLGDSACVLSLTSMRLGEGASSELFYADAPLPIGGTYLLTGIPFRKAPLGPVEFYANVRMLPDTSFSGDFAVQVIYSKDLGTASVGLNADPAVASASASAAGVPVPEYTLSTSGMSFRVDQLKVVQSVSGQIDLSPQGTSGQAYAIDPDTLGVAPTYAAVDAAFALGTKIPISGVNSIPAEAFGLVGLSLAVPVRRNLLIANEQSGARSYQVITITFSAQ